MKTYRYLLWGLVIVSLFCIGLYFFHFRSSVLSNDTDEWGGFGSYVGGLIGTILIAATGLLLYDQNQVIRRQNSLDIFFRMIQSYYDLRSTVADSVKHDLFRRDLRELSPHKFEEWETRYSKDKSKEVLNEKEKDFDMGNGLAFTKNFYLLMKGSEYAYRVILNERTEDDVQRYKQIMRNQHNQALPILLPLFHQFYFILNYTANHSLGRNNEIFLRAAFLAGVTHYEAAIFFYIILVMEVVGSNEILGITEEDVTNLKHLILKYDDFKRKLIDRLLFLPKDIDLLYLKK